MPFVVGYARLKGIYDIDQITLCDNLEANLIMFFNWGLLNIGAFNNISYHETAPAGGDMSRLRLVEDNNYPVGSVWEAFRNDWVWESGIDYNLQPIQVSGVYVNGTFYAGNDVTYGHSVNYPLGRILFNNPLPTNSIVNAEYSYRYFNWQSADVTWFRQVMFNSFRVDDSQFLQYSSGVWSVLAEDRVQLPAVVVEVIPRRTFAGFQLGGGQWVRQDVLFHLFTENPWDRKKLMDIITYQNDKTIWMFDKNLMAVQNRYPLDYNGSIRAGALSYPDMVAPTGDGGFGWRKTNILNMSSLESISAPPLYQAVVRGTFEVIFPEL